MKGLAIASNCDLRYTANLATLILSNAELADVFVKLPKFTIPAPAKNVIGLILTSCIESLTDSVTDIVSNSPELAFMKPTAVALSTTPLLVPDGANHGKAMLSLFAIVLNIMCDGGTTIDLPVLSVVNPDG